MVSQRAWIHEGDFRFRVGTTPGRLADFFALSADAAEVLAERRHWLSSDPGRYVGLIDGAESVAREFLETVGVFSTEAVHAVRREDLRQGLAEFSQSREPDFVLLSSASQPPICAVGGCVCFPSGWRLTDKLGLPVARIHDSVPGLNTALEQPIERLLSQLPPGRCVVRSNWGVCRSPELNQHLDRELPALEPGGDPAQAWLRVEDQCLEVMPRTGGIIFGIRVTHESWTALRGDRQAACHVARMLRTMPPTMRAYKRLELVADQLAEWLVPGKPQ